MANHLLLIGVRVDGRLTKSEYQKLINQLDKAKLPDGYYYLDGLENDKSILDVRNHRIVRELKPVSMEICPVPRVKYVMMIAVILNN
ncbi:hypothetical protein [Bombilactobacillus thymidiniphilus]|uniref:Uncharacterized protein n=1 Tax=Bombilactobacillus thymidiniphilus TaxID=2923363 RepID=A0ABY4PF08_9LACO|nr:hypothetical protein [Bombilactobacillus thymidiniphilus]UQS84099.1 hypothetical protein MOO47_02800 [Bombilactobacillus thymidiniphilus]